MKQIIIKENEAGQRLDKFLSKYLNQAPKSFLYKMLRKKNIVLNGKKADGSEKLSFKDEVKLFLADETIEKFSRTSLDIMSDDHQPVNKEKLSTLPRLEVVFENEHICLINKPWGILSQKADKNDISINEIFLKYLLDSKELTQEDMRTFKPSVCNRLDRNTTGLIIGGKSLYGLQTMSELLKNRSMDKYYLCIVAGKMSGERQIEGYLAKDEATNQVKIFDSLPLNNTHGNSGVFSEAANCHTAAKRDEVSYIKTAYKALSTNGQYSLLEVLLVTGRTHQIRAHLASIGCPIVGDSKYGSTRVNRKLRDKYKLKTQLLHSWRLEMPENKELLKGDLSRLAGKVFVAPIPEQFRMIMEGEQLSYGNMEFQRT